MASNPRAFPPGMALDAVGHALYARVTGLPAYTLARAESELLRTQGQEILAFAGHPREVVDLQSGDATQSRSLLSGTERYVAIDRCRSALDDALVGLASAFPKLNVRAIVGDSAFGLGASENDLGPRLLLSLGGSLGRLDPTDARLELARIRAGMETGDKLLLGMDLAKEDHRLKEAYDDPTDVYAAYVRNVLRRANREVGTDFRVADWQTVVDVQADRGRVEIKFEARTKLVVNAGRAGGSWYFEEGESIIVEHLYKPSEGQVAAMALGAGFSVTKVWTDPLLGYALFMLAP